MYKLLPTWNTFSTRLEEMRPRLYRLAFSWCNNAALADDLVQDTILKALEKKHQLKDLKCFHAWVFRILNNAWLDYLRRRKPETDIDEQNIACKDCPENSYEKDLTILSIRQAVTKLPVGQRSVITLVDLEGFTYKEVSEVLEIPIGTVMSRLSRARKSLEDSLIKLYSRPRMTPSKPSYLQSVK